MSLDKYRFLRQHLFYPALFFTLSWALIASFNLDRLLADSFYHLGGSSWAWKHSWFTESLVHKGGRELCCLLILLLALLLGASYYKPALYNQQRTLWYLLLAVGGSCLLVGLLKKCLAISCPWEFGIYGGHLAYEDLSRQLWSRTGSGCFPAGHASAGYAWVGLYFACMRSRWRWHALAAALGLGAVFGFVQQLRGAHFISHDLASLAICWFYSLGLYVYMFLQQPELILESR